MLNHILPASRTRPPVFHKKSGKIIFALVLCAVLTSASAARLFFPVSSPAYCTNVLFEIADSLDPAAHEETGIDLEGSFYLYSFRNKPAAVFYQLTPVGYAIYDPPSATVPEYSKEHDHPFYCDPGQTYYYGGVFRYYEASGAGFRDLATGQVHHPPGL